VFGLDFAPTMIELARAHATEQGVADRCGYTEGDVFTHPLPEASDYTIVMGFMDYVAEPRPLIERLLKHTRRKAFFSFPAAGGLLGWQRQLRYRRRCNLFLYEPAQLHQMFAGLHCVGVSQERLARDYFVTVYLE
jgi:SAM-dependent methyltransferase